MNANLLLLILSGITVYWVGLVAESLLFSPRSIRQGLIEDKSQIIR